MLDLNLVVNHNDRAALVCALGVATGDFVAVGDDDGWIILPPRGFIQSVQWTLLNDNAREDERGRYTSKAARKLQRSYNHIPPPSFNPSGAPIILNPLGEFLEFAAGGARGLALARSDRYSTARTSIS